MEGTANQKAVGGTIAEPGAMELGTARHTHRCTEHYYLYPLLLYQYNTITNRYRYLA